MTHQTLCEYLETTALRSPDRTAVVGCDGSTITFAKLKRDADALAVFLSSRGVGRGDRVGVVMPKSISAVVAIFGILRSGAAYVPIDSTAPVDRGRRILADCDVRAVVIDGDCMKFIAEPAPADLAAVVVSGELRSQPLPQAVTLREVCETSQELTASGPGAEDLAYILYTSGSTGMPKGAMISHRNAMSFIDWCSSEFAPTESDRFSSHAPFHFDASVLDLYLAVKHGASLHLISEALARSPQEVARFIETHRLTVWFSTPSILAMIAGTVGTGTCDTSSLRLVLFGGEVFPMRQLRTLRAAWTTPTFYNLYGPTEITTACTFARLPNVISPDRDAPFPIGFPCTHCRVLVLDDEGREVEAGAEGLLHVAGPSVFAGYWNRPAETAAAFVSRAGQRWYKTGDVVSWSPNEGFAYVGRKDRMVKKRGYRIELGEIEHALTAHPRVIEVAVVALRDEIRGPRLVAVLSCTDELAPAPSIVELKEFCSVALPLYMVPDRFVVEPRLPRTPSGKVDYLEIASRLQESAGSALPRSA